MLVFDEGGILAYNLSVLPPVWPRIRIIIAINSVMKLLLLYPFRAGAGDDGVLLPALYQRTWQLLLSKYANVWKPLCGPHALVYPTGCCVCCKRLQV